MTAPASTMSAPVPPAGRGPLSNRDFRNLWGANVFSGIGTAMHDTAAAWTMATLTTSATLVTLMQSMSSLPLFLFALPAGALADMLDRRRLVIWTQTGCLIVALGLALLSFTGHLTIAALLAVTFLIGIGNAVTLPSWQALIPDVVEKKQLPGAITLGSVGVNIARALGPMIGGLILAASGAGWVFLINSASFIALIAALMLWKRPPQPRPGNPEHFIGSMMAAFRFTRHSPIVRAVLIRNGLYAFCGIAPMALLPLVLRARGAQAQEFGLQMGAYGVGGIATAFFALPWLRRQLSIDALLVSATVVSAFAMAALGWLENPWLVGLLMFLAGAAWLTNLTTFNFSGQSAFPNWVRARSSAIQLLVMQGSLAVGALVWGQVSSFTNTSVALQVAAIGALLGLAVVKWLPLNQAGAQDLTPSRHWAEHALAVEPAPDDGPVLITVRYEIAPADEAAFRAAIRRLRSIRLRDGAYRWALYQDLEYPTQFVESFSVGSWSEHLRQHTRATAQDARIEEAVLAFHRGTSPVAISHQLMRAL